MRQYAVDLGPSSIRSNAVNADRIRTGLFAEGVLESRAKARGLGPDEYFRANLLGREVTAGDVADAFLYPRDGPSDDRLRRDRRRRETRRPSPAEVRKGAHRAGNGGQQTIVAELLVGS